MLRLLLILFLLLPAFETFASEGSVEGKYLSGSFASRNEDYSTASSLFLDALKEDPKNLLLTQNGYKAALLSGDFETAVRLSKSYVKSVKNAVSANMILAVNELKNSNYKEADKYLGKILKKEALNNTLVIDWMVVQLLKLWSKVGQGDMDGAYAFIAKLKKEKEVPGVFVRYQEALIYELDGKVKQAMRAYDDVSTVPVLTYHFAKYAGNFFQRNGKYEEARKLYLRYQEQYPHLGYFQNALKQDKNFIPKKLMTDTASGIKGVLLEAARALYRSDYYQDTQAYAQMTLYIDPQNDDAKTMLAGYQMNAKNYSKAKELYEGVGSDSDMYWNAQVGIAEALYYLSKKNESFNNLRKLDKEYPDNSSALLILADLLRQSEEYSKAADVYTTIIDRRDKIEHKDWSLFFARGICYESSGEWKMAEQDLLKSLQLRPGQPDVLNYLGYSWLDRGQNIEKAKKMVETAVKARPNDGEIVDSMGWALYSLGQYDEASAYLERAAELTPYDDVINDHLGDSYWKQGRYNEARFQWNRVIKYGKDEEIIEKAKDKLIYGLEKKSWWQ
ncbi:tetratricopeptide repeat protein [Rickettsiales bacterium]|nr:tetratricopeptide repeat protein [Rickettsiales bacterium]